MGAGASAQAEAITEVVRPARRYVPEHERDADHDAVSTTSASGITASTSSGSGSVPAAKREREGAVATHSSTKPSGKSNRLRETRIEKMMSKAELARRANLSVLTIDRVEKGLGCRMDTKRKILEALGLSLADRVRVFGEEE